ncbi:MAG: zinc-ribbon domain-containing protein [Lachnospiraceae bacterium]|nr:zinc-ribbon domain-containing protein [Lachnospiraceae bacterium]
MGNGASWVSFIILIAVCGVYYYFVSKFGDKIAYKIEEAMWGDRYHWEGGFSRRTYKHYSVIFAAFLTIWVSIKTKNTFLSIVVFAIASIVFYTAWRIMEDALSKGSDKIGDKVKDAFEKRNPQKYNSEPETQGPTRLADRYNQQTTASVNNNMGANEEGSKFCAFCGKKVPINAEFCSYCGKNISGT